MIRKSKTSLSAMLLCFSIICFPVGAIGDSTDKIPLKQKEMLNTAVSVATNYSEGSGTLIRRTKIDADTFEYLVLTNAHLAHTRRVDCLTGKIELKIIDTEWGVFIFDYENYEWSEEYTAEVIAENVEADLAILSFPSTEKLPVAQIANEEILSQIRIFDEVFAIGCQLSSSPSPTIGIISKIFTEESETKEWTVYGNTANITPGSSGGGLFTEYNDHYYLIGVPTSFSLTDDSQFITHLVDAISVAAANDLLIKRGGM